MKVQLEDKLYYVQWKHNNHVGETTAKIDRRVNTKVNSIPSYTNCSIKDASSGEILTQGQAFLGKKEKTFNKDIGRRVSLRYAISNFSKEDRKIFWEAYFKETNQKYRK